MKKLVLLLAFFVGTMSMFANEGTTAKESSNALVEIEIPLVFAVPGDFFCFE
ncbi:MAG: hypothetical protein LUF85_11960 [Bacteroides sp.]|nr:hypothetical protein [Bacteroides sp.]